MEEPDTDYEAEDEEDEEEDSDEPEWLREELIKTQTRARWGSSAAKLENKPEEQANVISEEIDSGASKLESNDFALTRTVFEFGDL